MATEFKLRTKLVFDEGSISKLKKSITEALGFEPKSGAGGGSGGGGDQVFGSNTKMFSQIAGSMGKMGNMAANAGKAIGGIAKAAGAVGGAGSAGVGAAAGSVVPGIGTAVGAAVGTVLGPMLSDIKAMLTEMSPMLASTLELTGTMVNMVLKPFADAFALVMLPIILFMYKYLIIPFYQYVYPALMRFVEFIEPIMPLLEGFALFMAVAFGLALVALGLMLIPMVATVLLIGGLVILVGKLAVLIGQFLVFFGKLIVDLGKAIVDGFMFVIGPVLRVLEGIGRFAMWMIDGTFLKDAYTYLIKPIGDSIWNALKWLYGVLGIDKMVETLGKMAGFMVDFFTDPVGMITDAMKTLGPIIFTVMDELLGALGIDLDSLLNSIWTILGGVWDAIIDVKDWVESIYDWVADIFEGIINGIKDFLSDIKTVITTVKTYLKDLTSFSGGGTVPGPKGAPQLAVVHGGEEIFEGGGSPITYSVTQNIFGLTDPEVVAGEVERRLSENLGVYY